MADGQHPGPTASEPDDVGVDPAARPTTPRPRSAGDEGTGVRALLERSRERIATEQAHLNE